MQTTKFLLLIIATSILLLPLHVNAHDHQHSCSAGASSCSAEHSHNTNANHNDDTKNVVTGFSVFHALPIDDESFKQELVTMVPLSRSEEGVVSYNMYKNPTQPGEFAFIESWQADALQKHLKGENVQKVFAHPYFNHLKSAQPQLFGPWVEVPAGASGDTIEMTFYWNVDCPKKKVWDVITDWTNASWVLGAPKTQLIQKPEFPGQEIQRRTWENGQSVDVRMVSKNESSWTVVEETIGGLQFPDVTYATFFVTMSLTDDGLDPDTQTRIRYHTSATLSRGTFEQGREALKADFYGPRIKYYQGYFNCSRGIFVKRALHSVENLYKTLHANSSLGSEKLRQDLAQYFAAESDQNHDEGVITSLDSFLRANGENPVGTTIEVKTVFPPIVLPDLRVVAVEDLVSTGLLKAHVRSRIVIYQLNEFGKITSARLFDQSVANNNSNNNYVNAAYHYYDVLTFNDIEKVRALYTPDAILEDPVGYVPPRKFDSVYSNFYGLAKSFVFTRSPERTYVWKNQVAQFVVSKFVLPNGQELSAYPVQVLSFNERREITHFEAFFQPGAIDFSKL